ncbi:endopeptidase La [Mycoplasmopsis verecunda]|uniref:endopeptidase La n=1 Tax=Mycoplasmopsis verecunda TaxID=171291 RepID=A0A1T4LAW9_9BACT|nr:endopeptidase La [Mycoplasmopsis verecunda]WPB54803.1 endopeptidase La [Mycoplasmopsis verecunda]SJZ51800.1 ATP-dependent Lon protease [Mycoplasmopsis verecunda]
MPKKTTKKTENLEQQELNNGLVITNTEDLIDLFEANNAFDAALDSLYQNVSGSKSLKKFIMKKFALVLDASEICFPAGFGVIEASSDDKQFATLYDFFNQPNINISDSKNRLVLIYNFNKFNIADPEDTRDKFGLLVQPLEIEKDTKTNTIKFTFKSLNVFKQLYYSEIDEVRIDDGLLVTPKMIAFGNLLEGFGEDWKQFMQTDMDIKVMQGFLDTITNISNTGLPFAMDQEDPNIVALDKNIIPFKFKRGSKAKRYTFSEIQKLFDKYEDKRKSKTSGSYIYDKLCTVLNFLDPNEFMIKYDSLGQNDLFDGGMTPIQALINQVTEIIAMEMQVASNVNEKLSKKLNRQQQEFIAREKIKQLQDFLEEMGAPAEEDEYTKIIKDPKLKDIYPESVIKLIAEEEKRSSEMMPASPEAAISKNYVSTLKKLPWRKVQKELLDISHVKDTLDQYHYGLEEIKERILEYLAVLINVRNQNKDKDEYTKIDDETLIDHNLFQETGKSLQDKYNNVPILTLVGPPGTGKTSLSKAIAEALNRRFLKISLGGVHDESEIRGHRRTYVGAMPGKIIKGITKTGVSNPVILLDEIDKMASDFKGDPASAMLEVLDPEQNTKFQDHYLEHEYDLSKCIFIATANYFDNIPPALVDRVEIIELSAYTLNEKVNIAKKYLMPKVVEQAGLDAEMFIIDDETLAYIIKHYTQEAGVRGLKRILDKIARKIVLKKLNDEALMSYEVKISELENLLGVIKFKDEEKEEDLTPGTVTGLAYTSFGGSTLPIEVTTYQGKSEIKLTGSLKEVMQESAQIALTYVRANADRFGIKDFDFESNTIHIHVPEGAVPKDGPSAGVTFTTAIISALSHRAVSNEIGMTGEITLRGKVLEIGGLKEKSFAAASKGLKRIFIPAGNVKNLKDVPLEIKEKLEYIPVKNYDEIYSVIFENKSPKESLTFKDK